MWQETLKKADVGWTLNPSSPQVTSKLNETINVMELDHECKNVHEVQGSNTGSRACSPIIEVQLIRNVPSCGVMSGIYFNTTIFVRTERLCYATRFQ